MCIRDSPETRFRSQQGSGPRDHELCEEKTVAPRHAPGDRIHRHPAQNPQREDHATHTTREGMGRGDWGYFYIGK